MERLDPSALSATTSNGSRLLTSIESLGLASSTMPSIIDPPAVSSRTLPLTEWMEAAPVNDLGRTSFMSPEVSTRVMSLSALAARPRLPLLTRRGCADVPRTPFPLPSNPINSTRLPAMMEEPLSAVIPCGAKRTTLPCTELTLLITRRLLALSIEMAAIKMSPPA